MYRSVEEVVGVHRYGDFYSRRKSLLDFVEQVVDVFDNGGGVRAGCLVNDCRYGVMAVLEVLKFYISHIFQVKDFSVFIGPNNHIPEFFGSLQTSFISQYILERLVALRTELAGGSLDILLGEYSCNIARHQAVLCHNVGFQPDTHGVVRCHDVGITYTGYTLNERYNVDFGVILEKFEVIAVVGTEQREYHKHTCLSFLGDYTHLRNFGRKQVLGFGYTVLYVYGSHIGIGTLFEVHGDVGRSGIGGGRSHI